MSFNFMAAITMCSDFGVSIRILPDFINVFSTATSIYIKFPYLPAILLGHSSLGLSLC